MQINEVIKYPILSEKTYQQMANNVYTFAVDPRTNRAEVKKTIEFIFDVKVSKVNIINIDKQPKKLGRFQGFTNRVKKAIISLSEGQINIFPEEAAPVEEIIKDSSEEAKTETKKPEISEAEKKAAEKIAAKLKEKTSETKEEAKVETKKADEVEVKDSTKTETKK